MKKKYCIVKLKKIHALYENPEGFKIRKWQLIGTYENKKGYSFEEIIILDESPYTNDNKLKDPMLLEKLFKKSKREYY